jgi:hypothetical protein
VSDWINAKVSKLPSAIERKEFLSKLHKAKEMQVGKMRELCSFVRSCGDFFICSFVRS